MRLLVAAVVFFFIVTPPVWAQGRTLALLAKSTVDPNFIQAHRGCDSEANTSGDRCLLIGPPGPADARKQLYALQSALRESPIDAMAVSVIHSGLLARALNELTIPIFSFDSPFSHRYSYLSKGYVGINNEQFGRDLATLAYQLAPQAGSLCIMSAAHDPNLAERVQGIRSTLSANPNWQSDVRLSGENGWREHTRCPWDSGDSARRAIHQLKNTLLEIKPTVFISVGHWPVIDPALFETKLLNARNSNPKTLIIVATGGPSAEQLGLLERGLVDGYIFGDFFEIGRATAQQMIQALEPPQANATGPQNIYVSTQIRTR